MYECNIYEIYIILIYYDNDVIKFGNVWKFLIWFIYDKKVLVRFGFICKFLIVYCRIKYFELIVICIIFNVCK